MRTMAKKPGHHDLFATVPVELWRALCADAEANQRSATGQLIWILREKYPEAKRQRPGEEPKRKGAK